MKARDALDQLIKQNIQAAEKETGVRAYGGLLYTVTVPKSILDNLMVPQTVLTCSSFMRVLKHTLATDDLTTLHRLLELTYAHAQHLDEKASFTYIVNQMILDITPCAVTLTDNKGTLVKRVFDRQAL